MYNINDEDDIASILPRGGW
jgi:hypothetical protein